MSTSAHPRRTRQRVAVAEALADTREFHTAQQVHELLASRGEQVALATVYRTLASLAEAGEIDSIRTPEGHTAYRSCEGHRVHHHHLLCRRCGETVEVEFPGFERTVSMIADAAGFTQVDHAVELYGLCRTCSVS